MARNIRPNLKARDERRDGIVARARTALRIALPPGQRLVLRRLIAAADARRRRNKDFA
jgi:hypothetical protein